MLALLALLGLILQPCADPDDLVRGKRINVGQAYARVVEPFSIVPCLGKPSVPDSALKRHIPVPSNQPHRC